MTALKELSKTLSSDYILSTTKEYSLYVLENRAIPKVTDGLKDGQRKFLWLMRNKADKIKTISLVGLGIQEGLYVHGDASAADTISKLAAPFLNNNTFLDGQGSFGTKINPYAIGAARYTYVKKSKFADSVLFKDLDIVPLKENYDGSNVEPVTFLPLIPTVLLNGISGIAVGWSTEILPRKFEDLKEATLAAIDGKEIKKLVPCYSFNNSTVTNPNEDNSWIFSGKVKIVDTSTLHVTELPPDLAIEKFRERLDDLEEKGKIKSYIDKSTKQVDITIRFIRGSLEGKTEAEMVSFLKLQTKKTERIVVIDWNFNAIRQYDNAEQLVRDFVTWRFEKYTERYQNQLKNISTELDFWKMIILCFDGNLPSKITNLKNKKELTDEIISLTKASNKENVERICSYPTYRWTKEFYEEAKKKILDLQKEEKNVSALLSSPDKLRGIFRDEVSKIKV